MGLYEIKPQAEEKKSYKNFLDDLAKTIGDVKEKEQQSLAIDADFVVADDDTPIEPPLALQAVDV